MRVRVSMPTKDGKRLREQIVEGAEKIEVDEMGQDEWEVVSIFTLAFSLSQRERGVWLTRFYGDR